jgi:hypothetical protein
MIEKGNPRPDPGFAAPVEIEFDIDPCFFGITLNSGLPFFHRVVLKTNALEKQSPIALPC